MMQGCHTPPPPHPMVSPFACQVGSCLVWPCCFPRLVLFGLVPSPPLWGAVCSTEVWYGCCRLLVVMSSLRALSSPPVGWGLWSFWLAPPRLCGAVCSTEIWYGCCRLLAVMSSLCARYHTKYDVALSPCKRCPCPCSDAVLRSCEEALAGIILHRPPSLWFAWVRSGCGTAGSRAARGPGAGARGGGGGWGGGPGPESMHACMHACMCVCDACT